MSSQGTDYSSSSRKRKAVYPKRYTPVKRQLTLRSKLYAAPTVKYDGEMRLTRTCAYAFPTNGSGMTISGTNFPAWFITFTPNDATVWGSSIAFQTFNIPNASEIAALYDRVFIEKVEVSCSFIGTDATTVAAVTTGCPRIWYAPDYTDGTTGNTLAQTQQQGACKFAVLSGNRPPTKMIIRPMYQRVVYYTAVASSYEPARGYVASGTSIPHYGVRMAVDNTTLGVGAIEFSLKFYFRCKNVK